MGHSHIATNPILLSLNPFILSNIVPYCGFRTNSWLHSKHLLTDLLYLPTSGLLYFKSTFTAIAQKRFITPVYNSCRGLWLILKFISRIYNYFLPSLFCLSAISFLACASKISCAKFLKSVPLSIASLQFLLCNLLLSLSFYASSSIALIPVL